MIGLEQLLNYYPPLVRDNPSFHKYILKEYIQLIILEYLTTTPWIRKVTFIGGTYLRLAKGIDRFSEDIDFDCKAFSREEFDEMTDHILKFLIRSGWVVEIRDKPSKKMTAFRRSYYFPGLLFNLGLSGYREERFLIKIEAEGQQIDYNRTMGKISGCGLFFLFPVPTDPVVCSMKLSALLTRQKGRDFYDILFLMGQTRPDFGFLEARTGIPDLAGLKSALAGLLNETDLHRKSRDFKHLLFNPDNNHRILEFGEFVKGL